MSRWSIEFLRDARDMARQASTYAGLELNVFADTREVRCCAVYCLIVVGEALNNIPPEIQALVPDIPWRAIIDMRHVLIHAYWRIDYEIVHEVVRRDCDELIEAVDRLALLLAEY